MVKFTNLEAKMKSKLYFFDKIKQQNHIFLFVITFKIINSLSINF